MDAWSVLGSGNRASLRCMRAARCGCSAVAAAVCAHSMAPWPYVRAGTMAHACKMLLAMLCAVHHADLVPKV